MNKEDLYKSYPPASQQNYYRSGSEEWIVFDDIMTKDDLKDIITVYLKDGKVYGWDKKELPKTPAERVKMIEDRSRYAVGGNVSGSASEDQRIKSKGQARKGKIGSAKNIWFVFRR